MNIEKFLEIEKKRAGVFNMFTALLCEPDEELIKQDIFYRNFSSYLEDFLPRTALNIDRLTNHVIDIDIQDFQVEYARLFIGPFKVPASPYSSLHMGDDIVMGKSTIWVENFYENAGIQFDPRLKDLPDHVAVETEFLYYLIYNEINYLDQEFNDEAHNFWNLHKSFFDSHYKIWIPKLCDLVIENSTLDYYKIIFKALKSFVTKVEIPQFPL